MSAETALAVAQVPVAVVEVPVAVEVAGPVEVAARTPPTGRAAAPALRRLPLPLSEPHPGLRLVTSGREQAEQSQLPLPVERRWDATVPAVPRPTGAPCLPEPREWAARFVVAAVEVAAGFRPAAQLARWTTSDIHATLHRRGRMACDARRPAPNAAAHRVVVRRLVACEPQPGVLEVAAVVADPRRVRAVALRVEAVEGRWCVTALELG